ncbi:unnamed protein product, partial [Chrysoparadoxa australica]
KGWEGAWWYRNYCRANIHNDGIYCSPCCLSLLLLHDTILHRKQLRQRMPTLRARAL